MLIAGAIDVNDGKPGRLRLAALDDYTAASLHAFIKQAIAPGSTAKTDGLSSYAGLAEVGHDPHVVGTMAAHIILPWIHTAFSNLKTWGKGVYHGLRRPHLQSYLDEFVFRPSTLAADQDTPPSRPSSASPPPSNQLPYKMLITPDVTLCIRSAARLHPEIRL